MLQRLNLANTAERWELVKNIELNTMTSDIEVLRTWGSKTLFHICLLRCSCFFFCFRLTLWAIDSVHLERQCRRIPKQGKREIQTS